MLILTGGVRLSTVRLQQKLAGDFPTARREPLPAARLGRRGLGSAQVRVTHLAEASAADWVEPQRRQGWRIHHGSPEAEMWICTHEIMEDCPTEVRSLRLAGAAGLGPFHKVGSPRRQ